MSTMPAHDAAQDTITAGALRTVTDLRTTAAPPRTGRFTVSPDALLVNGRIPLTWWTYAPNVGDLLSPYLVQAMTGLPIKLVQNYPSVAGLGHRLAHILHARDHASYLAIGSIINRAQDKSIVWGSGGFGTESGATLNRRASYRAVRGPLTRNLLRIAGIECPSVYGDPALLMPMVFDPTPPTRHRYGLVLRHSEREWLSSTTDDDEIILIDMRSDDVEQTLTAMLSCDRLIAASLHGLVLADAYGIPSAWLASTTPKGLEFKYYDYFLSVGKVRRPQTIDFSAGRINRAQLDALEFDDRALSFDRDRLLEACPFIDTGSI